VERQNAYRLSEREFQARKRSLAQRTAEFQRNAATLSQALAEVTIAYKRMVGTGTGIVSLLPVAMRMDATGLEWLFGASNIRKLAEIEVTRLSGDDGPQPPGARRVIIEAHRDEQTGEIAPLSQIVADLVGAVKTQFDRFGPTPTTPITEVTQ
jgi:hypothetical protein